MRTITRFLFALFLCVLPWQASAQDEAVADINRAFAQYAKADSDETRANLITALKAYSGPPTVETINAHLAVMMRDAPGEDYARIHESASIAAAHLEPVAEIIPKQFADARFISAVAAYNSKDDPNAVLEMAHIQGFTREISDDDGNWAEWAKRLHYRATAWTTAMQAGLYRGQDAQRDSQMTVDAIVAQYDQRPIAGATIEAPRLPFCPGEVRYRRKINYPNAAVGRGKYGAVVLGYRFDEEGRVQDAEILASVPSDVFDKESLRWVKSGQFRPKKKDQVGVTCRLDRENVVQTLAFGLG